VEWWYVFREFEAVIEKWWVTWEMPVQQRRESIVSIILQNAARRRAESWRPFGLTISFLILVAGVGDVISTNQGLAAGAVELNPVLAWIQAKMGFWWFLPKMALNGILVAIVLWNPRPMVMMTIITLILVNTAIILNNFALAAI
jgi:hypothetical protein